MNEDTYLTTWVSLMFEDHEGEISDTLTEFTALHIFQDLQIMFKMGYHKMTYLGTTEKVCTYNQAKIWHEKLMMNSHTDHSS